MKRAVSHRRVSSLAKEPGGIVATLLQQLLTTNAARIKPALPDGCGCSECGEQTRKVPDAWPIPGGNGATTFACPRCSKFAMTRGLIDPT